jgi:hypothetical protein
MERNTNFEEDELSSERLGEHLGLSAFAAEGHPADPLAPPSTQEQLQQLLKYALNGRQPFTALPFPDSRIPATLPGIFDAQPPSVRLPRPTRRTRPVTQPKGTDSFHDSESEDIYDLYNACNGIVRNGLLDINELNKLSQPESAALNVPRLKEIWQHTAAGCPQCANIIELLNLARAALGQESEVLLAEHQEAVDLNVIDIDSIS